jgi:cysteinyl-tRNA synthetase
MKEAIQCVSYILDEDVHGGATDLLKIHHDSQSCNWSGRGFLIGQ